MPLISVSYFKTLVMTPPLLVVPYPFSQVQPSLAQSILRLRKLKFVAGPQPFSKADHYRIGKYIDETCKSSSPESRCLFEWNLAHSNDYVSSLFKGRTRPFTKGNTYEIGKVLNSQELPGQFWPIWHKASLGEGNWR